MLVAHHPSGGAPAGVRRRACENRAAHDGHSTRTGRQRRSCALCRRAPAPTREPLRCIRPRGPGREARWDLSTPRLHAPSEPNGLRRGRACHGGYRRACDRAETRPDQRDVSLLVRRSHGRGTRAGDADELHGRSRHLDDRTDRRARARRPDLARSQRQQHPGLDRRVRAVGDDQLRPLDRDLSDRAAARGVRRLLADQRGDHRRGLAGPGAAARPGCAGGSSSATSRAPMSCTS